MLESCFSLIGKIPRPLKCIIIAGLVVVYRFQLFSKVERWRLSSRSQNQGCRLEKNSINLWFLLSSCFFRGPHSTSYSSFIHNYLCSLSNCYHRMESVALGRTSSQAKLLGTILSIGGAFIVTLYKGPPLIISSNSSIKLHQHLHSTKNSNWIVGGIFLTAEYILVPLWYILQVYNTVLLLFFINFSSFALRIWG